MKLTIAALIFAASFPFSPLVQAADIATAAQPGYSVQQEAMIESYLKQNAWSTSGQVSADLDDLSSVTQVGEANYAAITQVGSHNRADINQSGSNNVALISQNGNNMTAMIVQRGSNNLAMINQH